MPYPKPRRKRKRRAPLPWGPVLSCLLAGNVALGLALSPMTSLTKVRVENSLPSQEEAVKKAVKSLAGTPYALADWQWLESRITLTGAYLKVEHKGNIFGRAVLSLTPRTPAAAITEPASLAGLSLDEEGSIFATDIDLPGAPRIVLPKMADTVSPSVAQPLEMKTAAAVCLLLAANWPSKAWLVTLDADSSLTVASGDVSKKLGVLTAPRDALAPLAEAFGDPERGGNPRQQPSSGGTRP